jgi:hypothetical protein
MKVTIAYIEEPPFGWQEPDRTITGADIELADRVLRAIGVSRIEHHLTTFSELLPGVEAGRWEMNVPLFVTPERASKVAFSLRVGGSVLEAVEHEQGPGGMRHLPLGAFSFNKGNSDLLNAVNKQLRLYLGSPDYRASMAHFGLTHREIDPALVR